MNVRPYLLPVTLVTVALYVVHKFSGKLDVAADAVTKPIADAWVRMTAGPGVQVNAAAVLPNGQRVDMNAIRLVHEGGGRMTFMLGGRKYVLGPRRGDGLYPASPA